MTIAAYSTAAALRPGEHDKEAFRRRCCFAGVVEEAVSGCGGALAVEALVLATPGSRSAPVCSVQRAACSVQRAASVQ